MSEQNVIDDLQSMEHYILIRNEGNRQFAHHWVDQIPLNEEEPVAVKIIPKGEKRSEAQNAFLWGWLYKNISKQLEAAGIAIPLENGGTHPYTKDVLHELFKDKFMPKTDIRARNGKTLEIPKSTTKLTKKEFSEYCDDIERFVWEFWQLRIPPTYGIFRDYEQIARGNKAA